MATLKENTGTLHRVERKNKPTSPDYTGQVFIENVKYEAVAWIAPTVNKNGQMYLNITLKSIVSTHPSYDPLKPGRSDDSVSEQ